MSLSVDLAGRKGTGINGITMKHTTKKRSAKSPFYPQIIGLMIRSAFGELHPADRLHVLI